jgi:hypothetical protein
VKSSPFQKSLQIHYLFCATCKTTTGWNVFSLTDEETF